MSSRTRVMSAGISDTRGTAARLRGTGGGVLRALSIRPGRFVADDSAVSGADWQALSVEMPAKIHSQSYSSWRGRVDALAMRARFSDRHVHDSFQPNHGAAGALFDMLEQNRVEALGASLYAGVRANLAALMHERWVRARPEVVIRGDGSRDASGGAAGNASGWIETFALLTRFPLGAPLPDSASRSLAANWRRWMTQGEADAVGVMVALIADQAAFAAQALRVVGLVVGAAGDRASADGPRDGASRDDASGGEGSRDRPAVEPQRGRRQTRSSPSMQSDPHGLRAAASEGGSASGRAGQEAGTAAAYRAYTRAYDVIVDAANLYDTQVLAAHRRDLDGHMGSRSASISRWAHRLQRRLLSLQMRSWQFDREEGELDAGRLSRVATSPLEPLVFKQESEIEFPDSVVALLIDNSGSMRGLPIAAAAVCAELLGRVLERCGVKTEVLGFTTRSWRGGRSHRDWIAGGRHRNPGRLAELRHVVYKHADQPWRRAAAGLGAMLADDLLKENIDGEALQWAHDRLMRRREPRKILLVISDGAPLDDATVEANDPGYLVRHLRGVIGDIERRGAVELAAIGIGHDVGAYYRRAAVLRSIEDLSEALVTQLLDLFDGRSARP